MEKISCKKCGGDLIEMNGIFYCWSCDAKYALINGEPRLLKCKICGGDVIDCGDHYECELCGEPTSSNICKACEIKKDLVS